MTLLLTGYEPFGDHERNPSAEVTRKLDGARIGGEKLVGRVLPVEFERAGDEMAALIDEFDPTAVVATGLAAGRSAVSVERVGINVADCGGIPDNSDAEPRDERIRAGDGAAAAHFATLPVVATVERLLDAGIPARVSNSAGTHLCNSILYQTRAYLEAEEKGGVPTGFVHLPLTPEDAAVKAQDSEAASGGGVQASMTLEMQVEAVERVFEAALDS